MTRIVFMGAPEFAVPSLTALAREGYEIAAVYTRRDRPAGRGRRLEASPVKQAALARGLDVRQPATLRDPGVLADLAVLRPDVIVVAAYGLILPHAILDLPRLGCVNVHASLLPRHRGAAPVAAAILAGDRETGVSIMQMDEGVDTGPVLAARAIPIAPDDTTGSLTARLAELGADLLAATLSRRLRGELPPTPQPAQGATYAPRIAKQDGRIDWSEPAAQIARRVRAYRPWPSACTEWNGQTLQILRARAGDARSEAPPGAVVAGPRASAGVMTGAGILWLEEVRLAGRRALPIASFLAGARDFVGSQL